MYVCICNAVTDHAIRRAVRAGTVSFEQLRFELGVSRSCGRCERHARAVMTEALAENATARGWTVPPIPTRVVLPDPIRA